MAVGEERRRNAVLTRVGRVQRRLNTEVWLAAMVGPVWVGVTTWVLFRLFAPVSLELISLGLITAVVVATVMRGAAHRVTVSQAAVVADRQAGAGGLLLTRLETAVGAWELALNQQVKALPMPKIALWRSGRWVLLAMLFGLAGLLMPRAPSATKLPHVAAASRVDQLADKVEALAKEEPVPEAIAAELARLQAELDHGTFDATDWEAADSLEKSLNENAAEAAGNLASAEQAAANLAKQLADGELSAQKKAELEHQLMQLTQDSKAQEAKAAGGDQKPASAESLRQALEQRREALAKSFGQKSGAPSPSAAKTGTPQKGEGTGEGSGAGKGASNAGEGHASHNAKNGAGTGHGYEPPAELVFGGEADIDPSRLKFEPLPQGNGGDEPGELNGLRAVNPHVTPTGAHAPSTGQVASGVQAAGQREGPLLPRNRAVVDRYFQSK